MLFYGYLCDTCLQMLFLEHAKVYFFQVMPVRARYYKPSRVAVRKRFKSQCPNVRLTIDGNPQVLH